MLPKHILEKKSIIKKAGHDQSFFDTQRERKKVAKLLIDDPKAPDIKRGKQLVFIL